MKREDVIVAIIDDESRLRSMLVSFLEDFDFTTVEAESGEKAINDPECIAAHVSIVDMRMEGLDGNQTILELNARNPEMKFLLHTGSNNYKIPEELTSIGITEDEIFLKPVMDMTSFAAAVSRLLHLED